MNSENAKLAKTFDQVAVLYDAVRPGYPDALIDAVFAEAGLSAESRILEIGPGTGQITLPFARRGCTIVALEPGANLAAVARAKLQTYPRVHIEPATFEAWELQPHAFDLVLSAQAWHWVDPAVGYSKAAQALRPSGSIALVWNLPNDPEEGIYHEIQAVYERVTPETALPAVRRTLAARANERKEALAASGFFEDVRVFQFPWAEPYTVERYLDLLNTYSDHRTMPRDKHAALAAGIAEAIRSHGGILHKNYLAVLYLARPAPGSRGAAGITE